MSAKENRYSNNMKHKNTRRDKKTRFKKPVSKKSIRSKNKQQLHAIYNEVLTDDYSYEEYDTFGDEY